MNLTGIINENEFYTSHYLSEIFEGDIKSRIDEWNAKAEEDEHYKTPHRDIKSLSNDYFTLLDQLRKQTLTALDKLELSRVFLRSLLSSLGYESNPQSVDVGDGAVPLLGSVEKVNGAPLLWIVEAFCIESCDVLETTTLTEQMQALDDPLDVENYDAIITSHILTLEEPPRWVILISAFQIVLIDRAKWAQKRFIRFDLQEIFGRKEDVTLKAMAVLLHVDSLAPKDGMSLLDTLDENSHKHAFGVTEDLKYALREAIELLGNEVIHYKSEHGEEILTYDDLSSTLSHESLRYMYRLLFILYIESRPELGYVPVKSSAYLQGYSLENLRDLELMPLLTDSDKNGYFFHESIQLLFSMIYNGQTFTTKNNGQEPFEISPLRSHLFDPEDTPFLNSVKIRNHIWQKIIQMLSLSKPKKGKKGRGRISYANLGINQLGAVYEALLSYKGFIAKETLYEVKKAGTNPTPLENAYFVTEAQLVEYKPEERVFHKDGKLVRYPTGTFIYRLAGRDREKSASYYTPEVLTKSLVKYALKELLKDKTADQILKLTVCEPAMGSAAFLNEAINQLSEAYLQQKQIETGKRISHDKYILERQKVKMYLADNNVFGVDLNPTAVELAEISLWLNALFADENESFIPWFGLQLVNGNSLIGARREVYDKALLKQERRGDLLWYNDAPKRLSPKSLWPTKKRKVKPLHLESGSLFADPSQLPLETVIDEVVDEKSAGRKVDTEVYHFLLGDKAMANYTEKVVKALKKDEIDKITKWRKDFIKPYSLEEQKILLRLSKAIDALWQEHTKHQADMRKKTTDPLKVWGQPQSEYKLSDLKYKDQVMEKERLSQSVKSSSPYRRLKMVMDYWCSLWFWPIDSADELPSRAEYFEDISRLVEKRDDILLEFDKNLFSETMSDEIRQKQMGSLGFIDVNELVSKNSRLRVVESVSDNQKFLHWELEFADIFSKKGGFDLILGNPPWLLVRWEENGIMGEANPLFDIRKFSAHKLNQLREETLENYPNLLNEYIGEYESASATQNFIGSKANYPLLDGKANLYKCFLPTGWKIANYNGISGFLHPEGVYDDPKGGKLRTDMYKRLKYHFQFQNAKLLFSEIDWHIKFSINIYDNKSASVDFITIANVFLPRSIGSSFEYIGNDIVGGIKDDENKWNIQGHRSRIVQITKDELNLFVKLYDKAGTKYLEARLPAIHSVELLKVLEKLLAYSSRIIDTTYYSTFMFDETQSQTDGIIKRYTSFVPTSNNMILSGPHFFVGNPLYKTPKAVCDTNRAWDEIDLLTLPDNYLPRSNYVPIANDYIDKIPTVDFGNGNQKVTEFYRYANREMIGSVSERTLISTILPKSVAHPNTLLSYSFKSLDDLLNFFILSISIPIDFMVKSTGMGHANTSVIERLPILDKNSQFRKLLFGRGLILVSLTIYYKELYEEQFDKDFRTDNWTKKDDPRLNYNFFANLTPTWQRDVALRTDYERRQALVEIDVLVAQELKLTLEELKTIYRIQFSVLKQNENETYYDMNGRIVFTVSKGLTGVGLPRKADKKATPYKIVIEGKETEEKPLGWEDIINMQTGEIHRIIMDDTIPNGPIKRTIIYKAPFAKCDREKDYEVAWAEFERRDIL